MFDDFDTEVQCEDVYYEDAHSVESWEWAEDITDEPPMYQNDLDGYEYPEFDS